MNYYVMTWKDELRFHGPFDEREAGDFGIRWQAENEDCPCWHVLEEKQLGSLGADYLGRSYYQRVKKLWAKSGSDLEKPAHLQDLSDEAAHLDHALQEKLRGPVDQWKDGLIASVELVDKVMYEAFLPRK